ncbi:MAG: hypothetical protein H0T76_09445 [Nannocystis sp.]|nr:hypothetical protein [Nannocystis sp.]MBA3546693.1 hypothetical protein [Nannocystis sp.]
MVRAVIVVVLATGCIANPPAPAPREEVPVPAPVVPPVVAHRVADPYDAGACDAIYGYARIDDACAHLNGCGCPPAGCGDNFFETEAACKKHLRKHPRPKEAAPVALIKAFLARDSVCRRVVLKRRPKCQDRWTDECTKVLLAAAYMGPGDQPETGSCYYHDRKSCPDCSCDFYVKANQEGFDGETGCLFRTNDVRDALLGVCAEQRCGQ